MLNQELLANRPTDQPNILEINMNTESRKVRGLGLCSGGLDSILSALVLRNQGIEVTWINFETPFFSSDKAKKAAQELKIPLKTKNITPVYIEMLKNPGAGYGKNMNPCMDCHALMFRLAGEMMKEEGYDFLFSGEVAGQRPMSQTKPSLRYVEKHSGFDGYILRPLTAQCLPETIPEKEGLVDRSLLLDFSGRSRKPQIALAKKFGITDYPSPAGGCLLTDTIFSNRLRDLFEHQQKYRENELNLLKHGRHFRLQDQTKVIIGRTKKDNEDILKYHDAETDIIIKVDKYPGPIVLVPNRCANDSIMLAASMCVGYSKAPKDIPVEVQVDSGEDRKVITVLAISSEEVKHLMV